MKHLALAPVLFLTATAPALTGVNEGYAAFQRGDYTTAYREFFPLALQGNAYAQLSLGILYERGHGVAQDYGQALKWFRLAAEQGNAMAQNNLGNLYAEGRNVSQDYVQAHMWFNLAAASLSQGEHQETAKRNRDNVARRMTAAQIAQAQELARNFRPREETAAAMSTPSPVVPQRKRELESSGSGFVISKAGHVLTNAHVVDDCAEVRAKPSDGATARAEVVARDQRGDLALLKAALIPAAVASFREGRRIRQGEAVIAVGFPLHGLLASEANVSTGTVSALAGLRDDARHLQITAPVQQGNSGGPLLDASGNVVGIVVAKLDALKLAGVTGDIPQNVNFAIKAEVATGFLLAHGVVTDTAPSAVERKPADIGDAAKRFTLLIECWK